MMRFVLVILCGAVLIAPAYATPITFSIVPVTLNPMPGDVGDSFDVLLTNGTGAALSVAAFSFEVSSNDADVTLISADTFTSAAAYIFSGDSFDLISGGGPVNTSSGAKLDGSDLTNDFTNVSIASGATVGLGEVFYNVAPGAALAPFTISFSGGAAANNLSDTSFNVTDPDISGVLNLTITSPSPTSSPEPSSLVLLPAGLIALVWKARRKEEI